MKYCNGLLVAAVAMVFAGSSAMAGAGTSNQSTNTNTDTNTVDRAAGVQPEALGDVDRDLVFTPVTPCRLLDTRVAGGVISATSTRHFIGFTDSDFSAQGGDASDCGIPIGAAAIQVNLALVNPTQAGYATAYPFGEERPLAASINYLAGLTIANEIVIPLAQGEMMDFSLYSHRQSHAVADVSGYYMRPNAGALDCTYVSQTVQVAAGQAVQEYTACPTGYSATGGGCTAGNSLESARDLIILASEPGFANTNEWYCSVYNDGAVARSYRRTARCCRIPGR